MEHKGYLYPDGKVRQDRTASAIGRVGYIEQRYNLRRVLVSRTWVVDLWCGAGTSGETRREAVAAAVDHHILDRQMGVKV